MVSERERARFLEDVRHLHRVDTMTKWKLAHIAEELHLDGKLVLSPSELDDVLVIRSGEILMCDPAGLEDTWVDEDGLTRDPDGGRVAVDPLTGERVVGRLGIGDIIGRSVLATCDPAGQTLRTGTLGVDVIRFDAVDFHLLIARTQLACAELANVAPAAKVDVHRMGLFNDLPMRELSIIMRDGCQSLHRPGDTIVQQGESGDRFYFVMNGTMVVERDGVVVAQLGPGDHFGELALLRDAPRAASVRATSLAETWSVTREAFECIVRHRLLAQSTYGEHEIHTATTARSTYTSSLAARLRASGY
jgi:hypothetical protein